MSEPLNEEFEQAIQFELTDTDVERARLLIGVDAPKQWDEHFHVATPDAIRNWAKGMGDDNPLYVDESYGPRTRWGSQIAMGPMAGHVMTPMLGDPVPEAIRKKTKGLFRGVHVFVSGGNWDFYRPVFPGDRLMSFGGEESLEVKESEFAGRSVIQVRRSVVFNQRGEVVGIYRVLRVLTARKASRDRGKYMDLEPAHYSDEDIERIDAIYAQEEARGAEKRFWEDVRVGDELPPMVKGPLTVTEIIAVHGGGYGWTPYGLRASRLGYKNRKRIAPFYIKNEHGVPDVAQRLHWDSAWSQAIGNPMAYDYGVMRQNWFFHHVSDWMGDDGFCVHLEDSVRKFNYQGDTQFLSGSVVGKREEDGLHVVDLDLHMVNQRDTESAWGKATVSLPSRTSGAALAPDVPAAVRRRTTEMYARHNELAAQRGG